MLRRQAIVQNADPSLGRSDTPPGEGAVPGNKEYVDQGTGSAE